MGGVEELFVHTAKMKIKIYNEEITPRTHYCQLDDCPASCVEEPYINLYVKFSGCNAKCPFCIEDCKKKSFDIDKLGEVVKHISSKLKIRKVSFTGGEPTLNIKLLEKAFTVVKSNADDVFTVINTNGYDFEGIFNSDILNQVNSVSLSRHHYFDQYNRQLFGSIIPSPILAHILLMNKEIADKVHFSCNLIKGYIDSAEQIKMYLDMANSMGVHDVGFVSLMPLNEYCIEHAVAFPDVSVIPNLMKMKEWHYNDCCECANYLYLPSVADFKDGVVKVYHRNPKSPMNFENMLMFDGKNLKVGFNGKILK